MDGYFQAHLIRRYRDEFRYWPMALAMDILGHTRFGKPLQRSIRPVLLPMRLPDGWQILVRPYTIDAMIVREVWSDRVYSPPEIKERVRHGTVIDVGAHIGAFTLFAVATRLASRVISFEPDPRNFKLLLKNIRANRLGSVTAYQMALLDAPGSARLHTLDEWNTGIRILVVSGREGVSVPVVDLAWVFRNCRVERCDLLKIDAEGSEYKILSASPDILERISTIAMEFHLLQPSHRTEFKNLCELIKRRNYGIRVVAGENSVRGMLYATARK